jgi:hypothetical protein
MENVKNTAPFYSLFLRLHFFIFSLSKSITRNEFSNATSVRAGCCTQRNNKMLMKIFAKLFLDSVMEVCNQYYILKQVKMSLFSFNKVALIKARRFNTIIKRVCRKGVLKTGYQLIYTN